MSDNEVFQRMPASVLRPWLEKEREKEYRYLAEGVEMPMIHRAQGRVLVIERMLKLLDSAQKN